MNYKPWKWGFGPNQYPYTQINTNKGSSNRMFKLQTLEIDVKFNWIPIHIKIIPNWHILWGSNCPICEL
jgi:hypothetical protein